MPSRPAVCSDHIGRDLAVRGVEASLLRVERPSGPGRLVLVSGEAGVGKSRLAAEAMRLADTAGLHRLEGPCTPEATVPYACFVQALRRRTRTMPATELTALFDGSAALAAVLLPEVAAAVAAPTATTAPEDLFAAVWQLLARLGGADGAALLLEDLHWADADGLRMLAYLAGELDDLPLWLVATYRSDELHRTHPLTALLPELRRRGELDEIALDPLDRDQVRQMLSSIFDGTEVSDGFAELVLERTGGNPFFVEELARALVERGDVYHSGADWERRELVDIQMPQSVRETLLARARGLPAASQQVLQLAALAGERLDPDVLADALSVPTADVDEAVLSGLALQLLVERREGATPVYAFRHALTREALADELLGPHRRRAHRQLAEALVRTHGDDGAVAALVADHFAAAGDEAAALEHALAAARYARRASASDEADGRYDQALHLLPAGPDHDDRRLELLLEAAGTGDVTELSRLRVAFAQEARALAAARSDPVAQAAAINVLEYERWQDGDGPGALALIEEARELVAGRDDAQEAWVLRRMSRVLMLSDRLAEAQALIPTGVDLARRSGNNSALAGLLGTRMLLEFYGPGFHAARLEALAAARAAGDPRAELNVTINSGYVGMWSGDLAFAERAFAEAVQLGERIAPRDRYAHAGYAWTLALSGRYDEAVALAAPLRTARTMPTRQVALTALAEVEQRRASAQASAVVDELWQATEASVEKQRSVPALAARARQLLASDGIDVALPVFWGVVAATVNSSMRGSHWPFSPDCAQALAQAGRLADLTAWTERIRVVTDGDPNDHNLAAHRLCEGWFATANGDGATASALFTEAAGRYRAIGCPAREVEALLGLAAVADGEAAAAASDEAMGVARAIGAHALAAAAARALDEATAAPVLATILFTDVVGSTELAAALGDQGWSELVERHHAIVRRELAAAGGREIDTAGDGFLASFGTPAQAIRSAASIRDSLAAAGITVRAGLHTGEARESGGKLTGLTVHIASRVMQAAGPGEVLVSGTVRDLVVGSPLEFEDRGLHDLKGVPGQWRLFVLV